MQLLIYFFYDSRPLNNIGYFATCVFTTTSPALTWRQNRIQTTIPPSSDCGTAIVCDSTKHPVLQSTHQPDQHISHMYVDSSRSSGSPHTKRIHIVKQAATIAVQLIQRPTVRNYAKEST